MQPLYCQVTVLHDLKCSWNESCVINNNFFVIYVPSTATAYVHQLLYFTLFVPQAVNDVNIVLCFIKVAYARKDLKADIVFDMATLTSAQVSLACESSQ